MVSGKMVEYPLLLSPCLRVSAFHCCLSTDRPRDNSQLQRGGYLGLQFAQRIRELCGCEIVSLAG